MPRPLSDRMLPQRVRIERVGDREKDGRGGFRETLAPVAEAQRCRLKGASLRTFVDADGQLVSEIQIEAYFEPGADVRAHDVLTLAGGRRLIVHSADDQADGVYRKAFLTEEQAG